MDDQLTTSQAQAAAYTKTASKQTYYTIRFFVDRDLVNDAYLAYGYFRWVDDILDTRESNKTEKIAFINRQKCLLAACYRGELLNNMCVEEQMLADLVGNDQGTNPGLRSYLDNMMTVLEFDAERCGQLISQAELSGYSRALATAVTDAMHHFIGHDDPAPNQEGCYLAVTAAHITHMLRDTLDDNDLGYYNIPSEYLQLHQITPQDASSQAYQKWVCSRVKLARTYFKEGRHALSQVSNLRCRLVGYAYCARFEWMLRAIERDNFCLRSEYRERKSLFASFWMGWTILSSIFASPWVRTKQSNPAAQTIRIKD